MNDLGSMSIISRLESDATAITEIHHSLELRYCMESVKKSGDEKIPECEWERDIFVSKR